MIGRECGWFTKRDIQVTDTPHRAARSTKVQPFSFTKAFIAAALSAMKTPPVSQYSATLLSFGRLRVAL
jgi:hypothetical protein